MARGFESKDVEFQQAEASRPRPVRRAMTPAELEDQARRQSLELALSKARAERASATNPSHQQMLDYAILALEGQLAGV